MKHIYLVIFLIYSIISQAQQWEWVQQPQETFLQDPKISTDTSGCTFLYGKNKVLRYLDDGTIEWVQHFDPKLDLVKGETGNKGELYLIAAFSDSVLIENDIYISRGGTDFLFLKILRDGNVDWAIQGGSAGNDQLKDVHFDRSGHVWICGNFSGPGSLARATLKGQGFFVARFDSAANLEGFIGQEGGEVAHEIGTDRFNNLYLLGSCEDTVVFDNCVMPVDRSEYDRHFILKADYMGNCHWIEDLGGTYYPRHKNLFVDDKGNFYLSRWRRYSGFEMKKFNDQGGLEWMERDDLNEIYGDCSGIEVFREKHVFFTGYISSGENATGEFLWQYDDMGKQMAHLEVNSTEYLRGLDISSDGRGNIFLTGDFSGRATFGKDTVQSESGRHYIAKLNFSYPPKENYHTAKIPLTESYSSKNLEGEFQIYPNPSSGEITISLAPVKTKGVIEVTVYNLSGKKILFEKKESSPFTIDMGTQQSGLYFIDIKRGDEYLSGTVVIN